MRSSSIRKFGVIAAMSLLVSACGAGTDATSTTLTAGSPATTVSATSQPPETTIGTVSTTTTVNAQTVPINVFFGAGDGGECSLVKPHERQVAANSDLITAAFQELVGGPTPEEEANGAGSFFSSATAGTVLSATLEEGLLIVDFSDFRDEMNNASTSCGSAALLASLNATAFQFPEVQEVEYAIDGECATFYNWLQNECDRHTRQ